MKKRFSSSGNKIFGGIHMVWGGKTIHARVDVIIGIITKTYRVWWERKVKKMLVFGPLIPLISNFYFCLYKPSF